MFKRKKKQKESKDLKKIRKGYNMCFIRGNCVGCPYADGHKKCLNNLAGDMFDKIEELDERIGIMTEEEA